MKIGDIEIAHRFEGKGAPVVLVHGTPSYSYLWRNIIPILSNKFSVYALDLPGFGDSDKPIRGEYSLNYYETILNSFIRQLGIDKCSLVVHDLGGPTGLLWAVRHPDSIIKLIIMETGIYKDLLHKLPFWIPLFFRMFKIPLLRNLLVSDFGITSELKTCVVRKNVMVGETLQQYLRPFKNRLAKEVLIKTSSQIWNEMSKHSAGSLEEIVTNLKYIKSPTMLLIGKYKNKFGLLGIDQMERLKKDITNSKLDYIENAGHFAQEDNPNEVGMKIFNFLSENSQEI
jgi:pimeloyl-ACP methyl ester carboxylesterase